MSYFKNQNVTPKIRKIKFSSCLQVSGQSKNYELEILNDSSWLNIFYYQNVLQSNKVLIFA